MPSSSACDCASAMVRSTNLGTVTVPADADSDGDLDTGEDVYAAYKYLGAGKIVTEDYVDSKVRLNYLAGEFGEFRGLCQEAWERGTTNMK